MSQSNIVPFRFESHNVRVYVDKSGEAWWIAVDVCHVLGLSNVSDAVGRLESDEKSDLMSIGETDRALIINEKGLYRLIFRSNKPEAKRFQSWVFGEVLPQIRKTGSYGETMPVIHNPATQIAIETLIRIDAMEQHQKEQARQIDQLQAAQQYLTIREYVAFHQLTRQMPPGTAQQAYGKYLVGHCKEHGWPLRQIQTEGYPEWQYPVHVIHQTMPGWVARRNGQVPMNIQIEHDGVRYDEY